MADKAEVNVLFVPGDFRNYDYVAMIERLRQKLPTLHKTVVVRAGSSFGDSDFYTGWNDFLATGRNQRDRAPKDFTSQRPSPNELSLIMFTSGTTGSPKGVMHTQNVGAGRSSALARQPCMDETTVVHMASTFGHLTGYLFGVCLPIMLGGTGVFQDIWDANEFARLTESPRD